MSIKGVIFLTDSLSKVKVDRQKRSEKKRKEEN